MFLFKLTLRCVTAARQCRAVAAASSVHRRLLHDGKSAPGCGTEKASNTNEDNLNKPRRESVRNILQSKPSNQLYQVHGWVRLVQRTKLTTFAHLDDGSGGTRLQLVIPNTLLQKKLTNGSSLSATGRLLQSTGHQQPVELLIETIEVLGQCNPKTYEIGHLTKNFSLDYLRERIHMRPRVRYFQAVLRLRSELQNAVQIYMKQSEFTNVTTPMVTANDCEGGGECFTLSTASESKVASEKSHYFGRPTYLTVSGQLHLEALACSMSRVYTLSPVFRAEKSMSPKHLSEFLMLEVEEAFTFSLDALLNRTESMCKFLAFYLERHCAEDLQYLRGENGDYSFGHTISSGRYARVTYDEAVEVLRWMEPFKDAFEKEDAQSSGHAPVNLNAQMERALVELVGNRPLFVTHYPSKIKPFYMKTEDEKALCFDLLMPICGEVAGGSLREDNLEKLEANIDEKMVHQSEATKESLNWYLDLRRYGGVPLGGFGLGFDRFLQTLTGVANIKDVVPFPRWPHHCYL